MSQPLILPSCTTREPTQTVLHNGHTYVPLYCGNCAVHGGHVIRERANFAFWLCAKCEEKWEPIVGISVVPDEVVWAQMRAEAEAAHLAPHEVLAALSDGNSTLGKLARDLPAHD